VSGIAFPAEPAVKKGTPTAFRWPRMSLALKLGIALVTLVSLILIVNGGISVWVGYNEAKAAALRVQKEKAQAAAERVNGFVSDIENQIGWTTRAEWRRIAVEQQRYDFIRLLRQAPAITEISYVDSQGKEQLKLSRLEPDAIGSQKDLSGEERFKRAVAERVWFSSVYFRRGSEPYMTIAIAHAGQNPGVTTAEVNLKLVWDVVSAIRIGEKGYAFVVDGAGRLIAHPDLSLVLRDTDFSALPQVAQALNAKPPDEEGTFKTTEGTQVLSANAPIPRLGWIVFVQVPTSEAMAPVYASLLQTTTLLGFGLVLAAVAGTLLARRMVVPIKRLQVGAERLGGGDLSQRITIRTGDEIEDLAGRFNAMAGRLQESYETLEAKVVDRTRDLNEALQHQTATSSILTVIASSPNDIQPVLKAVAESACRICQAYDAIIFLREGQQLRVGAHFGPIPVDFVERRIGRGWASGRAVVDRMAVHVPDILASGVDFPDARDLALRLGFRTILATPLMRDEEAIGALTIRRTEARQFTEKQISLLGTFADQAVIAIENVRLFDEVQARTRELAISLQQQTATAEVLKVISRSAFDLQTVLDTLVASAARLCEADKGVIFKRDGDVYRWSANFGNSSELEEFAKAHPFTPGRNSVTSRVGLEGKTVHLADVLADPEYGASDYQKLGGYRAILGVPLLREGTPIGVFALTRDHVKPFTDKQIELVQTFADQAVIAIENVRLFEEVTQRTEELGRSLDDLRTAQERLVQTEKLASLGQLTAGIAHEIKNPLNFVNNFAALSKELASELAEALDKASLTDDLRGDIHDSIGMLVGNLDKIVQHGKRADSIVKNMLLHSREGSGDHRPTAINPLVEESLNLAYHGARAEKPNFNVKLEKDLDPEAGEADIFPQEITRVLLNLISNGFYASAKRKVENGNPDFLPTLSMRTRGLAHGVEIRIRDNGTGIPEEIKSKMFNPFYTTKPAGEGTGLGLSISHDIIVKQHGGRIEVSTSPGSYTEFVITLPRAGSAVMSGETS
jgi:signal transduction histidine kinase